jgi:hypothetical protein
MGGGRRERAALRCEPETSYPGSMAHPTPSSRRVWVLLALAAAPAGLVFACSAADESAAESVATGAATSASGAGGAGGGGSSTSGTGGDELGLDGGLDDAEAGPCVDPPSDAGLDAGLGALLAPPFAGVYSVLDLGPIPGMPPGHLGGTVIAHDDPDTLLVAGDSEAPSGGIYRVKVKRSPCGHIVGFEGSATLAATTPYVDANLVYGTSNVLLYTQWPVNQLSQLLPGAGAPAVTDDMTALGIMGGSVSGLGFVPPNLAAAFELRTVTWSSGYWYHLGLAWDGQLYDFSSPLQTATLPGGPGGFAYVPAGSPGFAKQSLIVAEWSVDTVGVYEVDDQGDPLVGTRRDFFSSFPKPWGAYFEPQTGDFLFLTWGSLPDRVFVVQGFAPPPPPPPPPR